MTEIENDKDRDKERGGYRDSYRKSVRARIRVRARVRANGRGIDSGRYIEIGIYKAWDRAKTKTETED